MELILSESGLGFERRHAPSRPGKTQHSADFLRARQACFDRVRSMLSNWHHPSPHRQLLQLPGIVPR